MRKVVKVLQAHKVHKGRQEHRVHRVLMDQQVYKEDKNKVLQDRRVRKDQD